MSEILTREEYEWAVRGEYDQPGQLVRGVKSLLAHDAAFRERDERQREQIVKLRAAIEQAPHDPGCGYVGGGFAVSSLAQLRRGPCNCWKAAALADEKEENRG